MKIPFFKKWQSFYCHSRMFLSGIQVFIFLLNCIGPLPLAQADNLRLPAPGVMVRLSPPLDPPILKAIKVHPDNPFRFDFILDKGNNQNDDRELRTEATKLIKYFLASLTIPEKDLWVNLSPYEKDRIIPQSFGLTEMGRDLLAEDYMLKQITASLIYPEDEIGKKFWKRIYEEAEKKFGTMNIPVNTFNKVWIVPEKAVVYENAKAATAYVVEAKLKVMLEQDYLALSRQGSSQLAAGSSKGKPKPATFDLRSASFLGSQIVREVVIPELTKEVNEGKNFTQLRQVYSSLILATWYKKKIKDSILAQVYEDKNKIAGVGYQNSPLLVGEDFRPNLTKLKKQGLWGEGTKDAELIYQRYLQAFKKGVFNYIKEEVPMGLPSKTQGILPRKYFSGGLDMAMTVSNYGLKTAFETTQNPAQVAGVPNHAVIVSANFDMAHRGPADNTALQKANSIDPLERLEASEAMISLARKQKDQAMKADETQKKTLSRREFLSYILALGGTAAIQGSGLALSLKLNNSIGKNQERIIEETYKFFKEMNDVSMAELEPELLKKDFVSIDLNERIHHIGIATMAYGIIFGFWSIKQMLKDTKISKKTSYEIIHDTTWPLFVSSLGLAEYLWEHRFLSLYQGATFPDGISKITNIRVMFNKRYYKDDIVNDNFLFTAAHEMAHMLKIPGNVFLANGYALFIANKVASQEKMPAVTLLGLAKGDKGRLVYSGYYLAQAALASGLGFFRQEAGIRKIAKDEKLSDNFISLQSDEARKDFFIQIVNNLKDNDYKPMITPRSDFLVPWAYVYGAAMGQMALEGHKNLDEGLSFLYHLGVMIQNHKKIDPGIPGLKDRAMKAQRDSAQINTISLKDNHDILKDQKRIGEIISSGQPYRIVAFHGRTSEVEKAREESYPETLGEGFYLTDEKSAKEYAHVRVDHFGGNAVVEGFDLDSLRLLVLENNELPPDIEKAWRKMLSEINQDNSATLSDIRSTGYIILHVPFGGHVTYLQKGLQRRFFQFLQSQGYEGLVATEGGEGKKRTNHLSIVIFDRSSSKIKKREESTPVDAAMEASVLRKTAEKIRNWTSELLSGVLMVYGFPMSLNPSFNKDLKDKDISLIGHRHHVLQDVLAFSFYDNFTFQERTEEEKQQLLEQEQLILSGEPEVEKGYREDLQLLLEWLKKHRNSSGGIVVGKEATPYELKYELKKMSEVYPKIRRVLEYLGENNVDKKSEGIILYIFGAALYAQYFHLNGENFKIVGLEDSKAKDKVRDTIRGLTEKFYELGFSLISRNPDSFPEDSKALIKFLNGVAFREDKDVQAAVQEIKRQLKFNGDQERILKEVIDKQKELLENNKKRNVAIVHNIQALAEKHVLLIIGSAHINDLVEKLLPLNVQPEILKDHPSNGNNAMVSGPGGIDLTPAKMNLQTKMPANPKDWRGLASFAGGDSRFRGNGREGGGNDNRGFADAKGGIQFHLDPAMLQQLQNAPGFVPVIINIQPLKSLPEFLGLKQDSVYTS